MKTLICLATTVSLLVPTFGYAQNNGVGNGYEVIGFRQTSDHRTEFVKCMRFPENDLVDQCSPFGESVTEGQIAQVLQAKKSSDTVEQGVALGVWWGVGSITCAALSVKYFFEAAKLFRMLATQGDAADALAAGFSKSSRVYKSSVSWDRFSRTMEVGLGTMMAAGGTAAAWVSLKLAQSAYQAMPGSNPEQVYILLDPGKQDAGTANLEKNLTELLARIRSAFST